MIEWFTQLGMTRDHCFPWTGLDKTIYILANVGIAAAYVLIPINLLVAYRKSRIPSLPERRMLLLFSVFIFFCGVGHLISNVLSFWYPAYRLMACWDVATAVVSFATAAILPGAVFRWLIRETRLFTLFVLLLLCAVSHAQQVTPSSLVMGLGGKITIAGEWPEGAVVRMDGRPLPTTRLADGRLRATVWGRRFWSGPKRLQIGDTVIDGQFELTALRPYGEQILFTFEDENGNAEQPTELSFYRYYKGSSQSHVWRNAGENQGAGNYGDGVFADPTHPSAQSYRQEIDSGPYPGPPKQIWLQRWDGSSGFTGYRQPDGLWVDGPGAPIPEAVGCNRMVYDYKHDGDFGWKKDIGTYHADPDIQSGDSQAVEKRENAWIWRDEENRNYHFYCHYAPIPSVQEWRRVYNPWIYTSQRPGVAPHPGQGGNGSNSVQGPGATLPVGQTHSISKYVLWNPNKTLLNSPFDLQTRLYINNRVFADSPTRWDGLYQYYDDVGFASVNEYYETTPRWAISVTPPDTWVTFRFSLTNTHPTRTRNWYTQSCHIGSWTYEEPRTNYFIDYRSGEGLYHDANANGEYDAGDTKLEDLHNNWKSLPTPLQPGETRHFIYRVRSPAADQCIKANVVFIERRDEVEDAGIRFIRMGSSSQQTYVHKDAAYPSWHFIANSRSALPADEVTVPQNVSAVAVGSDTWLHWDTAAQTMSGHTSYYEIERDGAYYRTVSAASPGFIDTNATGHTYRVRMANTQQTLSDWAVAQADTDPTPDPDPPSSVTITIQDNDEPPPPVIPNASVSVDDATISEDGVATVTVTLSEATTVDVTVGLTLTGTATRGVDYNAPDSVVIPAGQLTGTAAVTAIDDADDEPDETVTVTVGEVTANG